MNRNWGLGAHPASRRAADIRTDRRALLTLIVAISFGVFAAAVAAASFAEAKSHIAGLFRGASMVFAVSAACFGCWAYVVATKSRFARAFDIARPAVSFGTELRFYARATATLGLVYWAAHLLGTYGGDAAAAAALACAAGGMSAAAAFQTVFGLTPRSAPRAA